MGTTLRAERDQAVLLVVDLQEKLLPQIADVDGVLAASAKMIRAAQVLGLPIVATEQYPKGIGSTEAGIRELLADVPVIEKMTFSSCGVEPARTRLSELGRPHVVVVGIEAHVCVQQTVLDLIELAYVPFVLADAVSSRNPDDRDVALLRMRQAGAIVTSTEAIVFELCREAGTLMFKELLPLIK
jgi:nicotinamidase-related amidase